ncbi:ATPase [Acidovorax sp. HMWF018]|uniref:AAA family ATPase n=1 Tax=Acidovorax sp. HMWF018 TaxID=2056855 RepID=UPI000D3B72C8|nr:AAA family ATPase [Acidovorax sp. HMWF018]PTT42982.1 ATPase [Acidovorax sp. HMWF018]
MKPSAVKQSLQHLVTRKRPVFIWGPVGAGKSDVVASVAKELGLELRDVRLNLMDPVDLKGFPVVRGTGKTQTMAFVPPDFLPTKGKGILFLDEMNSAPQSVQAAAYQLILNRKLGDYEMPDGWAVIAAGNRASDRSVVNAQPAALANRFVHIDFEVDVDDWFTWATQNGVSDITRAFIKFRSNLLHSFDPATNPRAFPSPRSWVFVDDVLQSGLAADTEFELIKGTVGEGAAAEYIAFAKMARDLPTAEEILANPTKTPVPAAPATMYAISTMLDKKATTATLATLLTYMGRLPVEFQVLFMRSAGMANRDLLKTKEFVTWMTANQDVVI